MKKIFSFLLLLLPAAIVSGQSFWIDKLYYKVTNGTEKTVEFNYCSKSVTSVTIPGTVTYEGITYSVTAIGEDAFYRCENLTSVEIPSSVTSIGNYAFEYCYSLTNIEIPKGVTSIGDYAFRQCDNITNIEIPSGVTSIGISAFSGCGSLKSIMLPSGITSIGAYAFSGCTSLTNVTLLSATPPTLGATNVFYNTNSSLTVYVPSENLQSYKNASWGGLSNFVGLPSGTCGAEGDGSNVKWVFTKDNTLVLYGTGAMKDYTFLNLPPYVKSYYTSIKKAVVEVGVTRLGVDAFFICSNLEAVELPEGLESIGNFAFSNCGNLPSIEIPSSVTDLGDGVFKGCLSFTSVEIPSNITTIGVESFRNCIGLTNIEIPSGVTAIGKQAFQDCSSLTDIEIPSGVTTIDIQTFQGCSSLTGIEIPSSVTTIGNKAFSDCTAFTSIEIPSGVTTIGDGAFSGCTGLTSLTVNATTPAELGSNALDTSSELTVYVPYSSVSDYKTKWSAYEDKIQGFTATVTNAPVAVDGLVYDNSDKVLVTEGTAEKGTMAYSLAKDGEFKGEIPNGKEAKTYTVYYKAVGDGKTYGDSEVGSVEVSIAKAENEWTEELSIEGWTYGEAANNPFAAAKFGDVAYTYSKDNSEFTGDVPKTPGIWYVKAAVEGTENYAGIEKVISFNIVKKYNDLYLVGDAFGWEINGKTAVPADEYGVFTFDGLDNILKIGPDNGFVFYDGSTDWSYKVGIAADEDPISILAGTTAAVVNINVGTTTTEAEAVSDFSVSNYMTVSKMVLDMNASTLTVTGEEYEITGWEVLGAKEIFGGENGWADAPVTMNQESDGTWTATLEAVEITSADTDYEYRARANKDVNFAVGIPNNDNAKLTTPAETGAYNITFTLNVAEQSLTAKFEKYVAPGPDIMVFRSDVDAIGWQANAVYNDANKATTNDNYVYLWEWDNDITMTGNQIIISGVSMENGVAKYSVHYGGAGGAVAAINTPVAVAVVDEGNNITVGVAANEESQTDAVPVKFNRAELDIKAMTLKLSYKYPEPIPVLEFTAKVNENDPLTVDLAFNLSFSNIDEIDPAVRTNIMTTMASGGTIKFDYLAQPTEVEIDWDAAESVQATAYVTGDGECSVFATASKTFTAAEAGTYAFRAVLRLFENGEFYEYPGTLTATVKAPGQPTAIAETAAVNIYAENGTIYCDAENYTIYNAVGQDVTAMNGSLKGIYVVVVEGNTVKIRVN